MTAHPRRVSRVYGVRAVGRFDPIAVLWSLTRCQTLIFGGGGLLQDESGLLSLLYYTALLRLGRWMGKEVILHAGGIGPLIRPISKRLTAKALHGVAVTVRDPASRRRLAALGVDGTVETVPDPAFSLVPVDSELVVHLLRRYGLTAGQYAVLAPRDKAPAVFPLPTGLTPVLIPFFPAEDRGACLALQRSLPRAVLVEELSPAEIMGVIGASSLVLGMRLHALIFAERMGVPCQVVGDNPKLTEYQTAASHPLFEQG
jgi:polysaccharide pyruvyl transferase CsaB